MVNGRKLKRNTEKARLQCLRSERSNKQIPNFMKGRFSPAIEIKDGVKGLKSKDGEKIIL